MAGLIDLSARRDHHTRIVVGRDLFAETPIRDRWRKATFIVDERVLTLQGERVRAFISGLADKVQVIQLAAGENAKTLDGGFALLRSLTERGVTRDEHLVAVGGGTVTDLVSFAAQMLFRGVPCTLIPTTVLAQIDAAIGGKNGLNLNGFKNRIGSFYYPEWVLCDTGFLDTLPTRQICSGVAEALKVSATSDEVGFAAIEGAPESITKPDTQAKIVSRAIQCKASLLADDPFELKPQRLLNFGHSFAHIFEEESHFTLTHGKAVLLSMLCEVRVGQLTSMCGERVFGRFLKAATPLFSPQLLAFDAAEDRIGDAMRAVREMHGGSDYMVVLSAIGRGVVLREVPEDVARAAWRDVVALLQGLEARV